MKATKKVLNALNNNDYEVIEKIKSIKSEYAYIDEVKIIEYNHWYVEFKNFYECYDKFSQDKYLAFRNCIDFVKELNNKLCNEVNFKKRVHRYGIVSYNKFMFMFGIWFTYNDSYYYLTMSNKKVTLSIVI